MSDTRFEKKKKYGQNFLTNSAIPARIAAESSCEGCGVIEIGPGLGILTRELLKVSPKVVAVEIDRELIPRLEESFSGCENLVLLNGDILECDIASIISEHFKDMQICVCANLPYYVTTPILMKLLSGNFGFKTITVMVQREVADRITAKNGSDNSSLTVVCSYYAEVKKLFGVSAGSFSPPPKVNSAVVRFDMRPTPLQVSDEKLLFSLIHSAFGQRRKTLLNSLTGAIPEGMNKSQLADVIASAGISPTARAEELNIFDYISLCNKMISK